MNRILFSSAWQWLRAPVLRAIERDTPKPPQPSVIPPKQRESEPMQAIHLIKSKRAITKLIFHHFGEHPPAGMNAAKIRVMHMNRKPYPFDDIGYHGVIMPDGEFQIGRDIDNMGAHASGSNRGSIGIMFVAGIKKGHDFTKPTEAQLNTARLIIEEQKRYYPDIKLLGHRDTKPTLCPGFDIHHWYETNEVRK